MRTKRLVVDASIALGLAVIASGSVFAQLTVQSSSDLNVVLMEDHLLRVPSVVDAPFSADVVDVWTPGSITGRSEFRATARYYRDREGRVRVEQMLAGDDGPRSRRVLIAPDPADPMMYLLDEVTRTAMMVPRSLALSTVGDARTVVIPILMDCFVDLDRPQAIDLERHGQAAIVIEEEPLEPRIVAGVQTTGARQRTELPLGLYGRNRAIDVIYERWTSPDLRLEVHGRSEDSDGEVVEHRLSNISRAEPPAALFELPEDYRVIAMRDRFRLEDGSLGSGIGWLNARAPQDVWQHGWLTLSEARERCVKLTRRRS